MSQVNLVMVAPLPDGRLQIWVVDIHSQLWSAWKLTKDPDSQWSAFSKFETPPCGASPGIAVAPLPDGRLQIWVSTGLTGGPQLWSAWKLTKDPDSQWSAFSQFETPPGGPYEFEGMAVAPLPDGRLQIWVLDNAYQLWSASKLTKDPDSQWSAFSQFEMPPVSLSFVPEIDVAPLPDGRLQIWVLDNADQLWSAWMLTKDPDSQWSAFSQFETPPDGAYGETQAIAVAPLPDGRLQIWVIDDLNQLC